MTRLDLARVNLHGVHLVEASAGTGKTYALTALHLRMVLEAGLGVPDILVVTFTKAATAELRERIRQRMLEAVRVLGTGGSTHDPFLREYLPTRSEPALDRERLVRELGRIDEAAVYTIHGFCQRVLGDHAFESGQPFETTFLGDSATLAEELEHDAVARRIVTLPQPLYTVLRQELPLSGELGSGKHPPLGAILREAIEAPDRAFVPTAQTADADVLEALERAEAAAAAARDIWEQERDAVVALLSAPAMDARRWGKRTFRRAGELDAFFASDEPVLARDTSPVERFTLEAVADGTKKGKAPPWHPLFEAASRCVEAITRGMEVVRSFRIALLQELVAWARTEARARKAARGVMTYSDLLYRLDEALGGAQGDALVAAVRQRYRAALVDEFQDTDPVQFRIFRRLFEVPPVSLFLVGDPKQAIYSFRGADVYAYLEAVRQPGVVRHTLPVNYRSDAGLVAGVNAIFSRGALPFLERDIPFSRVDANPERGESGLSGDPDWIAPLDLIVLRPPEAESRSSRSKPKPMSKDDAAQAAADAIACDIAALLSAGVCLRDSGEGERPLVPGDVAVLVREHREIHWLMEAFKRVEVPAVMQTDMSVFCTGEAATLQALVAAIASPEDGRRIRGALATPLFNLDAPALARVADDEAELEHWSRRFRAWAERWERLGFLPAVRQVLGELDVEAQWLACPDGERRLVDLHHLVELAHVAATAQRLDPAGLGDWLANRRARAEAGQDPESEADQIRLERDARAVQVLTMHRAKGLEYPVVYCASLWRSSGVRQSSVSRFHDPADGGRLKSLLVVPDQADEQAAVWRESLAEELRLAYVALTRARHRCTVVWAHATSLGASALGYLLHRPAGAAEAGKGDLPADAVTETLQALQERCKGGDPDVLRDDLTALAEAVSEAGGRITLRAPQTDAVRYRVRDREETPARLRLTARQAPPPRQSAVGVASFTSLVRRVDTSGPAPAPGAARAPDSLPEDVVAPELLDGRDRDEEVGPVGALTAVDGGVARVVPSPSEGASDTESGLLEGFPGGVALGNLVHGLLERLPPGATEEMVAQEASQQVQRFGLDPVRLGPVLASAVCGWLSTPLRLGGQGSAPGARAEGSGFSLGSVPASDQARELEFTLPVRGPVPALQRELAVALRTGAAPGSTVERYAERLASGPTLPALGGWLRGFIDLVVRRTTATGVRWFLFDYKTNDLGPKPTDYAPEALAERMMASHYVLQYHLYAVALCRHLAVRQPGIDLEAAFGGCDYLFLRGLAPEHPAGTGEFFDRPPLARLDALCRALCGGGLRPGAEGGA